MRSKYHYLTLAIASALVGGFLSFWFLPNQLKAPVNSSAVPAVPASALAGWKNYDNKALGFSLSYPSDYTLVDNKTSVFVQSDPDVTKAKTILKFEKIQNTVPKEVLANFGEGVSMGWFTNSQKLTALKLDIATGDANSRERIYYFLKDFPVEPGDRGDRPMTMIRAGVVEDMTDANKKAIEAGAMNVDALKTAADGVLDSVKPL